MFQIRFVFFHNASCIGNWFVAVETRIETGNRRIEARRERKAGFHTHQASRVHTSIANYKRESESWGMVFKHMSPTP